MEVTVFYSYLGRQLTALISSVLMRKYSKELLKGTICIYFKFWFKLFTYLVSRSKIKLYMHPPPNLRSYPPSLYLDAGKEGIIHLLFGSYVQNPDSGFFSNCRQTILVVCCLLISCHISTRLPARSWSENRMVQTKRVFARTSFLLC